MKKYLLSLAFCLFLPFMLLAQEMRGTDKSPMDMAYFPDDFAHDRRFAPEKIEFDRPIMRVIYSRPAMNGREIFGKLVPYDKVWRVGANEAPEIRFYEDVTLGGKSVKAGDYALLAIPGEDEWSLILSSDLDQWGAYSYDQGKDVLRINAATTSLEKPVEHLSIQFEGKGKGVKEGSMKMAWDRTLVTVPFSFR